MSISYYNWITEVENKIASHIETELGAYGENVMVVIERGILRRLPQPVISLVLLSHTRSPSGGMNFVENGKQGFFDTLDFVVFVTTDDSTGMKLRRNKLGAMLTNIVFGDKFPNLLAEIYGIDGSFWFVGNLAGGSLGDMTLSQAEYRLRVRVNIPFPSSNL